MQRQRWEGVLFGRRSGEARIARASLTVVQFAWLLARDLYEGRLTLHAMSLVYSTLIAMVPLLAFGVSALKGLGVNGILGPALDRLLEPLGQAGNQISDHVVKFVSNVQVGVLGALGIALLAVTAISLLHKIESGLNEAWQVTENRRLLTRAVQYVSLLVVGPVFLFAAFGLTATVTNGTIAHKLSVLSPLLPGVLGKLLPYVLVVVAFTMINLITPNTRVTLRAALAAGIAGGLAWQTAGLVFAVLAARSTNLSAVYSSFAILILFLSWVYVSWLILLLGARIGFYVQNPAWRRPSSERIPLSPAAAEAAAVQIMLTAAERFAAGGRPLSLDECAGLLGLPALRLEPVLDNLIASELLFRVSGRRYVLARDPDKVLVAEVIAGARGEMPSADERPWLGRVLAPADRARRETLGTATLANLLDRGQPG